MAKAKAKATVAKAQALKLSKARHGRAEYLHGVAEELRRGVLTLCGEVGDTAVAGDAVGVASMVVKAQTALDSLRYRLRCLMEQDEWEHKNPELDLEDAD